MSEAETLSIGEVAQATGIRPSALRYYEDVGVLPTPQRRGGQRRYQRDVIQQVRFIQSAQRVGFSLEEMKMLLQDSASEIPYAERLQQLARRKLPEVEALIAQALTVKRVLMAALDCQCESPGACVLFAGTDD